MQVDDLTLEVRDRTLARVGQVTSSYLSMKARVPWCGVGEWELTLPGDHPMVPHLAAPGSGVILLGPGAGGATETLFSGPTRQPKRLRNRENPDGSYTFLGVTDEVLLQAARAFPDPTIADAQASSQSRANDVQTFPTEALMDYYVGANIVPGWAPAGRIAGLRQYLATTTNLNRGLTQSKSPRFQNLLELLQEIATFDPDLGFRLVQVGPDLVFQVLDVTDRTGLVRFDVENGTVQSEEVVAVGPHVTRAIVGGQGEGKDRQIVTRTTAQATADEALWGIVWEDFKDQRDTNDTTELNQAGDEALIAAQGGSAVKLVPADDLTMRFNVDWANGDLVSAVVDDDESVVRVTEWVLLADASGVMVGAGLGDVSGFDAKDAESAKVQSLDQRVSNLERAGSLIPARLETLGRGTTAERDAFFGVPATDGARASLANRKVSWFNTDLGWEESFYATTGLSGLTAKGLVAGVATGWYPVGDGPFMLLEPTTTGAANTGNYMTNWNGSFRRNGGAAWFGSESNGIDFVQAGRYDFGWWTNQGAGSGQADYHTRVLNAAGTVVDWMSNTSVAPLSGSYFTRVSGDYFDQTVRAGQQLKVFVSSGALSIHNVTGGTTYPSPRGQMYARYRGPALVSD